jgi:hypothetical protein
MIVNSYISYMMNSIYIGSIYFTRKIYFICYYRKNINLFQLLLFYFLFFLLLFNKQTQENKGQKITQVPYTHELR